MIDHLKSMAIFVSVVEAGTFRGAATRLGLSPSVISDHVSNLEKQLGAALLYRSTRSLSLTEKGERLFETARDMVDLGREGLEQFADRAENRLTTLRVAMPATMNAHPIFKTIATYAAQHPGIMIHLISSDRQIDLERDAIDVAIRMGSFRDSNLKTRRVGSDRRAVIASPLYLQNRPEPKTPDELRSHDFVSFSLVPNTIAMSKPGEDEQVLWGVTAAIADSADAVRALCLAGMGIAALPHSSIREDLEHGRLKEVLPDWTERILPINMTWPQNATLNTMTRKFIDFVSAARIDPAG